MKNLYGKPEPKASTGTCDSFVWRIDTQGLVCHDGPMPYSTARDKAKNLQASRAPFDPIYSATRSPEMVGRIQPETVAIPAINLS